MRCRIGAEKIIWDVMLLCAGMLMLISLICITCRDIAMWPIDWIKGTK